MGFSASTERSAATVKFNNCPRFLWVKTGGGKPIKAPGRWIAPIEIIPARLAVLRFEELLVRPDLVRNIERNVSGEHLGRPILSCIVLHDVSPNPHEVAAAFNAQIFSRETWMAPDFRLYQVKGTLLSLEQGRINLVRILVRVSLGVLGLTRL